MATSPTYGRGDFAVQCSKRVKSIIEISIEKLWYHQYLQKYLITVKKLNIIGTAYDCGDRFNGGLSKAIMTSDSIFILYGLVERRDFW